MWINKIQLKGKNCTLMPLELGHHDALVEAVNDGEIWKSYFALVPSPAEMKQEISRRLNLQKKGEMVPFIVVDNKTQKIVGMTTYCWLEPHNRRLGIGWTWYSKSAQQTAINTECKLLLLTYAFEKLNCIYVGFRVHRLNKPSQKAVERLGAQNDGIIRNYAIMPNGDFIDMIFYSILCSEWRSIKTHINWLLNNKNY